VKYHILSDQGQFQADEVIGLDELVEVDMQQLKGNAQVIAMIK